VFTKFLSLQFTIKYKKGATNCVANALSRRRAPDASLCAISQLQPAWLSDVIASYDSDQQAKELLTRLSLQDATLEHFTLRDGVIRYKNRIWLPTGHPVIVKILESLHVSPVDGHSRDSDHLASSERTVLLEEPEGCRSSLRPAVCDLSMC
jgi:hypothetical protein